MDVNYPEPKDMYRCHPYHFLEIYKPPVNEPIGSYQIQHLNSLIGKYALNLHHILLFFKSPKSYADC